MFCIARSVRKTILGGSGCSAASHLQHRAGILTRFSGRIGERYPLPKPIHHWELASRCPLLHTEERGGTAALAELGTGLSRACRQLLKAFRLDREDVSGDTIGYHRVAVAFVRQYINSSRSPMPMRSRRRLAIQLSRLEYPMIQPCQNRGIESRIRALPTDKPGNLPCVSVLDNLVTDELVRVSSEVAEPVRRPPDRGQRVNLDCLRNH
jgi:hypothetical protein